MDPGKALNARITTTQSVRNWFTLPGQSVQGDGKVDVTYDDLLKAGWSVVLAALSTLPRQVDSMQLTGVAEM